MITTDLIIFFFAATAEPPGPPTGPPTSSPEELAAGFFLATTEVFTESVSPFTGDMYAYPPKIDTEGRIKIEQRQPYPMTILATFGDIEFGGG